MASFLLSKETDICEIFANKFSSLSESGFIPTKLIEVLEDEYGIKFSSLSESGFIPTQIRKYWFYLWPGLFSSLSESGFIPTGTELVLVPP